MNTAWAEVFYLDCGCLSLERKYLKNPTQLGLEDVGCKSEPNIQLILDNENNTLVKGNETLNLSVNKTNYEVRRYIPGLLNPNKEYWQLMKLGRVSLQFFISHQEDDFTRHALWYQCKISERI